MIKSMEGEAEYEEGTKQTSDDTESVEMNEEATPRLDLDAPDSSNHGPTEEEEEDEEEEDDEEEEEEEEEEEDDDEELREKRKQEYKGCMRTYRQLVEERETASRHNVQLQVKLSEYFSKKACDERPAEEKSYEELLQEFRTSWKVQADLKQQLRAKVAQLEGKLQEVDHEQLALSGLQSTGGAQATAKSARPDVQLQQVVALCRHNNKLRMRISRLAEQVSTEEDQDVDPLLLQFHHLQLASLERERNAEKLEKTPKLQRMFVSSLERLTNVKAKLDFSRREVQAKRGQLAELEATLDEQRNVLTRIRQTREKLQRDNLNLKDQRGLLGNKVLLGDFEDTMEDSDRLEERLLLMVKEEK